MFSTIAPSLHAAADHVRSTYWTSWSGILSNQSQAAAGRPAVYFRNALIDAFDPRTVLSRLTRLPFSLRARRRLLQSTPQHPEFLRVQEVRPQPDLLALLFSCICHHCHLKCSNTPNLLGHPLNYSSFRKTFGDCNMVRQFVERSKIINATINELHQ